MAETVTYADLKFVKLPLKEPPNPDGHKATEWDETYENVNSLKQNEVLPVPPEDNVCHLSADIQLSRDLRSLSSEHRMMNSSLFQIIQIREQSLDNKTRRLSLTQHQVQQLGQELEMTKHNLQTNQHESKMCREEMKTLSTKFKNTEEILSERQGELEKTQLQLQTIEKNFCPDGWIRFHTKCLFISENLYKWQYSQWYCENYYKSSLLVLKEENTALQSFLQSKQTTFWVGKEPFTENYRLKWRWPMEYNIWKSEECGTFSEGSLGKEHCSKNLKFICEKSLVLMDLSVPYSEKMFSTKVYDMSLKCYL